MKNLYQEEWAELIANDANAIIIDCRSLIEWDEGILENANLIDILNTENFIYEVNKLDKEKNYYVYCRSGARSVSACRILESLNIKNTYNLLGGIINWDGKIITSSKNKMINTY